MVDLSSYLCFGLEWKSDALFQETITKRFEKRGKE